MTTVHLTTEFLKTGLIVPEGKTRIEFCDTETQSRGLYLEVTASMPGQGIYRLRWKDASGKTNHARLGRSTEITLDQARLQAAMLKHQIAKGVNPKPQKDLKQDGITLHDFFFDHYLDRAKQMKRSWAKDEQLFKRIDAAYGSMKVKDITRHIVQKHQTEMMNSGLFKPATVNHHQKLSRRLLNLAVEAGMLDRNPLNRMQMLPENNMVENYMDAKQLAQLLKVLTTHDNRPVCLVCLWLLSTGARSGEALKAKWSEIDRDNRVWKVPAVNAKGKRVRSIALNDSALQVLDQLKTKDEFEHLFINMQTGLPFTTISKTWERLRAKAGLPHLRIHDLRHQYASMLINSGRSLFEVQKALGHSDPSVTQRYAHLSTKSMQEAADSASIIIQRGMLAAAAA
jgi:integrase